MPSSIKHLPHHILTILFLSLSFFVQAQSEAHVHGLANLMMAMEGDTVEIQFESPAANILGFEHKATTAEEIQVAEQAEAKLELPESIFSFSGSSCELQDTALDLSGVMDDEHHDERDEDANHANHDEEHASHSDDHEDEHHEGHSEITANYHFSCDNVARITSVSVYLFEQFPGLEKIDAMWVTETQQGAQSLSPENTSILLR